LFDSKWKLLFGCRLDEALPGPTMVGGMKELQVGFVCIILIPKVERTASFMLGY